MITSDLLTHGGSPPVDPHTETIEFEAVDQYTLQAEAFAHSVLTGSHPPVPEGDAVANAAVIDRIMATATKVTAGQSGSSDRS